jgi:hypothetical protein
VSDDEAAVWREQRRAAADEHLAAIERRKSAESAAAAALLHDFVTAARERGIPATRLRARSYSGSATYRTQVEGWHLKRNGSVAVGTDACFYVLSAPGSLAARFTGVVLHPSPAPLVIGAGGRDGESIPLQTLLTMRLDAAAGWDG